MEMIKIKINWGQPKLGEEELEMIQEIVKSGWIGGNGPITKKFEKEFARAVGARYSIAVCNGTCGLILGLMALKEKIRLQIAVPTWTFIATANSARLFNPTLTLVDCNKKTFNIDWRKISLSSTVIIPVDVGGVPADYDKIINLPFPHYIFADSAESVGATYRGKKMGELGIDLSLFSFHATKIITTGEGGMLTTNNKKLYELLSSINNQGYDKNRKSGEYKHIRVGYNFRMTEMQSAIGLAQLKKLNKFLKHRRELANIYYDILGNFVEYQKIPKDRTSSYFLFTILVDNKIRNKLVAYLRKKSIGISIWKPVHMQLPYYSFKYNLPNSEYLMRRTINLPLHNALDEEQVKYIAGTILKWLKR